MRGTGYILIPEVVGYKEHSDGTITLNVHVVYPYAGDSNVYMHDVTVRPLSDRGFQYVSNYIVSEEENNNITWHTPRLTEDEWNFMKRMREHHQQRRYGKCD